MGSSTNAQFKTPRPPARPIIATALLALLLAGTSHAQPPRVVTRTWGGVIEEDCGPILEPERYDVSLTITQHPEGRLTGSVYTPRWGETDWPVDGKRDSEGWLTLGFTDSHRHQGLFKLQPDESGQTLSGQYTWRTSADHAKSYRVRLMSLATPATRPVLPPAQAQIPVPPFPYAQERVAFTNGDLKISGVLAIPSKRGRHPAVVLIPGSEAHTAEAEIPGSLESSPWIQVIADHLTRAGFATLRTDSRGVGGTAGDFDQATLQDLATDAQAAVTYLRSRKDIDPARLGLVGHSQGASVAAIAAAHDQHVRFLVMLGGAGLRGDRVMLDQLNARWNMIPKAIQFPDAYRRISEHVIEMAAAGASQKDIRERMTAEFAALPERKKFVTPAYIAERAAFFTCPRWRSDLQHDPRDVLAHCTVPVLAMSGEQDFQVDPKPNLPAIRDALRAAGNADVTIITLPGLEHSFGKWGPKPELLPPGQVIDPAALAELEKWLDQHVARPRHP